MADATAGAGHHRPEQVSRVKVGSGHDVPESVSPVQVGLGHDGPESVGPVQVGPGLDGPQPVSPVQVGLGHDGPEQVGPEQVGSGHGGSGRDGSGRDGSGRDGSGVAGATETAAGSDAGVMPVGRKPWAGWDVVLRIAGVVISVLAAVVSGVLELLLTTLRAGDFVSVWRGDAIGSGGGLLVPVVILVAAGLNWAIAGFAVSTTGRRWALGPPWALWTLVMLFAAGTRTPEGDYLLGGEDWVALVMILVGSLTFAVYSYRMILKRPVR